MIAPAPADADFGEEGVNVGSDGRRNIAGEHLLEMPAREGVLALEKEGAGEFEPDAH